MLQWSFKPSTHTLNEKYLLHLCDWGRISFCNFYSTFLWLSSASWWEMRNLLKLVYWYNQNKKTEKTQLLKQKSSLSSKRGDKRNLKVSLKTKLESLSTNAGNGSAAPGSSFSGMMMPYELLINLLRNLHYLVIWSFE